MRFEPARGVGEVAAPEGDAAHAAAGGQQLPPAGIPLGRPYDCEKLQIHAFEHHAAIGRAHFGAVLGARRDGEALPRERSGHGVEILDEDHEMVQCDGECGHQVETVILSCPWIWSTAKSDDGNGKLQRAKRRDGGGELSLEIADLFPDRLMDAAEPGVPAHMSSPPQHRAKQHSTILSSASMARSSGGPTRPAPAAGSIDQ